MASARMSGGNLGSLKDYFLSCGWEISWIGEKLRRYKYNSAAMFLFTEKTLSIQGRPVDVAIMRGDAKAHITETHNDNGG